MLITHHSISKTNRDQERQEQYPEQSELGELLRNGWLIVNSLQFMAEETDRIIC